jgi:hypothetical protein
MREVLNAIFYVLSTGRQRRTLPNAAQKYGALYFQMPYVDTLGLLLSLAVHPFERYARTVAAFIRLAMILLCRRRP